MRPLPNGLPCRGMAVGAVQSRGIFQNGVRGYRSQGRVNVNGPLTGRLDDQVKGHPGEEVVITAAMSTASTAAL
ncbi:hypothetical protein GCM10022284_07500 [Streptomyces hundungensis]